ncbi:DUF7696 family protein [Bosea sp. 2RAB26]|uniref:DUF7696 family protein n=1 Tax=Bosea sp. 2RAB26 TaxID=3237476 RepID=UPI003F90C225
MPGSSPRVVWSRLVGREVLSDSGEWRHECEVEYLLSLPEAKRAESSTASAAPWTAKAKISGAFAARA